MSRNNREFKLGNPRPQQTKGSQKFAVRQKLLRHDRYRDWTPTGPLHWGTPGKGVDGESAT